MTIGNEFSCLEEEQKKLKKDTEQAVLTLFYNAQQQGLMTSAPIISKEYQGRGNSPHYSYGGRARETDISKLRSKL